MKKTILSVLSICSLGAFAQEAEVAVEETTVVEEIVEKISISGFVDTYYRTNLTAPNDINPGIINPGTSFANGTGFNLGTANVVFAYDGEKVGFVADLAYGERAAQGGASDNINQAYVYLNLSDKVTATMGKFNTFLGYEVIASSGNFNYSTSYLFSNGPFSHTGLKFDFQVSEDFSLMGAIMNVTDKYGFTAVDPDTDLLTSDNDAMGAYGVGVQAGYKGQYLNFINHDTSAFYIDYTGGFQLADPFYLGINAAYHTDTDDDSGYYGVALYPQVDINDKFSLGVRGEYFTTYTDGSDDDPSVIAGTVTANYKVGNLRIVPEVRFDSWSNKDDAYIDNDGEPAESLGSFLLGAIYSF